MRNHINKTNKFQKNIISNYIKNEINKIRSYIQITKDRLINNKNKNLLKEA